MQLLPYKQRLVEYLIFTFVIQWAIISSYIVEIEYYNIITLSIYSQN